MYDSICVTCSREAYPLRQTTGSWMVGAGGREKWEMAAQGDGGSFGGGD